MPRLFEPDRLLQVQDLRQRHQERTRAAIVDAAVALFTERGFAATTVEDIAARADVAPRTFFRYFPTKDAVLYFDKQRMLDEAVAKILARPAGESPQASLLAVMNGLIDEFTADNVRCQLLLQASSERAGVADFKREMLPDAVIDPIAGALATRVGLGADDLGLRTMVAVTVVALGTAMHAWLADGATGAVRPYVNTAMAACRSTFSG